MRKTLFVSPIFKLSLCVLIVVLLFGDYCILKNYMQMKDEIVRLTEEVKYDSVDLVYVSENIYNKKTMADYFANRSIINVVNKSDSVWWDEISTKELEDEFSNSMGLKVPEVNYEEETIIYSLGRKIVSMKRYATDWYHGRMQGVENPEGFTVAYVGVVTFSEEYFENQVFFYKLYRPKGREQGQVFVSSVLESPFYIQEDGVDEFKANSLPIQ